MIARRLPAGAVHQVKGRLARALPHDVRLPLGGDEAIFHISTWASAADRPIGAWLRRERRVASAALSLS